MSHYFGREGFNRYTVHRVLVMESPLSEVLLHYSMSRPTINHKKIQHATDGHCNITHSRHLCTYMYTQMCMYDPHNMHVYVHVHVHVVVS